ncbi:hypothetical protein CL617_03175 [archaeon]|nr:hypothetical protein [archaeon]|tara:strand:+ start:4017 stop:4622 length:606 start_codon:yes stop_codon:yes gene_type:complete
MEIQYNKNRIVMDKTLNMLDEFTISITSILNSLKIRYVIVSGYVVILFGRNRASEDIDIIIEKIPYDKFTQLWKELENNFECINTTGEKSAYNDYLIKNTALRFSEKGKIIPNVEIKFSREDLDHWTLQYRKQVLLNKKLLYISPIELQISFKLFLGSQKDIEDAKFLYNLFKNNINLELLHEHNRKLKVEALFNNINETP